MRTLALIIGVIGVTSAFAGESPRFVDESGNSTVNYVEAEARAVAKATSDCQADAQRISDFSYGAYLTEGNISCGHTIWGMPLCGGAYTYSAHAYFACLQPGS